MDSFLLILGFILMILGIAGSFLPVLPGPLTSWFGFLLMHLTDTINFSYWFLGVTLVLAIFTFSLDYWIPIAGSKRFGGTKTGLWGASWGMLVGLFFPPFGILLGPMLGALIGELIGDFKDPRRAFKSALGTFLGFLAGTFLQFLVSLIFLGFYIAKLITHWDTFYNP